MPKFLKFLAPTAPKLGHLTQIFSEISKSSHFMAPSAPKTGFWTAKITLSMVGHTPYSSTDIDTNHRTDACIVDKDIVLRKTIVQRRDLSRQPADYSVQNHVLR